MNLTCRMCCCWWGKTTCWGAIWMGTGEIMLPFCTPCIILTPERLISAVAVSFSDEFKELKSFGSAELLFKADEGLTMTDVEFKVWNPATAVAPVSVSVGIVCSWRNALPSRDVNKFPKFDEKFASSWCCSVWISSIRSKLTSSFKAENKASSDRRPSSPRSSVDEKRWVETYYRWPIASLCYITLKCVLL